MQLYYPDDTRHRQRRVCTEACKDLNWWAKVLALTPERSILKADRQQISLWSDAAGTKGLGAFYIQLPEPATLNPGPAHSALLPPQPQPGMAFAISLPRYITRTSEHINTKEMRVPEQALLHWGKRWRGMKVVMNTDNKAVAYGMENRTIRGGSMKV